MIIAHYIVLVGPHRYAEYGPSDMQSQEEQDAVLGAHIREAVQYGRKTYGVNHEVRVQWNPRQIL